MFTVALPLPRLLKARVRRLVKRKRRPEGRRSKQLQITRVFTGYVPVVGVGAAVAAVLPVQAWPLHALWPYPW